jgi:heme A synthase
MSSAFARISWAFCAYLILVILFGAWVRISGAGAGCGNHWPTCHGEVIPVEPSVKTLIEFTHRVTSGLSGLWGLALVVWAWRLRSAARPWAYGMFFYLLVVNTMLLMLCAVATAVRAGTPSYRSLYASGMIFVAMAALVFTNATGAITALGDTLFPTQPATGPELWAKVRDDISASQHFLVRLRILHPIVAMLSAAIVFGVFTFIHRRTRSPWAAAGLFIVLLQVLLGFANIWLAAPPYMQIGHLLTAQVLWVALVAVWLE